MLSIAEFYNPAISLHFLHIFFKAKREMQRIFYFDLDLHERK